MFNSPNDVLRTTSASSPIPTLNASPSKPIARSPHRHDGDHHHHHHNQHNQHPFAHNPRRALFKGAGAPTSFSASSSPVYLSGRQLQRPHNHLSSMLAASSAAGSGSDLEGGEGPGQDDGSRAPMRRPSLSRVESLPNLSQLHLKAAGDWSSVVIPQPRKALLVPSYVMAEHQGAATGGTYPRTSAEAPESEDFVHEEALSELLGIIRSSSHSGWVGADSPKPHRTPYDDDEDDMDIPSLSYSPGIPRSLGRSKSSDTLDSEASRLEYVFGTPPSRAPNPLAFSCHFASIEQGAELDLFRPSPPLYEAKGPGGSLAWD